MDEITFKDFQKLMLKRKRSVDDLVDLFRGKLEDSRSFFERVMSCQWRNPDDGRFEDRGDVVIPYRSVIKFYAEEVHYLEDSNKKRTRQPMSEERKLAQLEILEKARAAKVWQGQKSRSGQCEIIEEVNRELA